MLIDEGGLSREKAYDTVQPLAMKAWKKKTMFRDLVEADETITSTLSDEDIDEAFNLDHHTRNIERIFERVGLE
jgi:adenylosuccinate lyase